MSHEISIVQDSEGNDIAEMFYTGKEPWHGLGQQLDGLATTAEALAAAHLDWPVEQRRMWWKRGEELVESDHYVTIRTDIERALGVVGPDYVPLQNVQAFDFIDALLASDEAKFETAGALFNGRKVWVLARIPGTIRVMPGDEVAKFITLVNAHDGSSAVRVFLTPVRIVCNNTLTAALSAMNVKFRVVHTGDVKAKLEEARRVLGIAIQEFSITEQWYKAFAAKAVTGTEVENYFAMLLHEDTPHAVKVRGMLWALYQSSPLGGNIHGTLWGAYNAVTDYVDHYRGGTNRQDDRHWHSILMGDAERIKRRAFHLACRQCGGDIDG